MSVIVFCEYGEGGFKKFAKEAMTYGRKLAESLGTEVVAVVNKMEFDEEVVKDYGISSVYRYGSVPEGDSRMTSLILSELFDKANGRILIIPFDTTGKNIAGQLGKEIQAGVVGSVIGLPISTDPLIVPTTVFAGKATAEIEIKSEKAVLAIQSNSIAPEQAPRTDLAIYDYDGSTRSDVEIIEEKTLTDEIPLPEAEIVVSGGRGMKGPENWPILIDLAKALGAATACSRPVADSDWRPHHEHVGQTGLTIRPNLYIAIGISGAIQHLGGVNNSKTIVVINKDSEAPFFKAADYGVVGDLFEVVPRLTEAIQKFKAE